MVDTRRGIRRTVDACRRERAVAKPSAGLEQGRGGQIAAPEIERVYSKQSQQRLDTQQLGWGIGNEKPRSKLKMELKRPAKVVPFKARSIGSLRYSTPT